jgi:hypothetical protein
MNNNNNNNDHVNEDIIDHENEEEMDVQNIEIDDLQADLIIHNENDDGYYDNDAEEVKK